MAKLPIPNPIDSGQIGRGTPVDHVRTERAYCFLCDTETKQHVYKAVDVIIGFGAPLPLKIFQKRSSTKGKAGRRNRYSQCTQCETLYPNDEKTADRLLEEGWFGDIDLLPDSVAVPVNNQHEAFLERVSEEKIRRFPSDRDPLEDGGKPAQPQPSAQGDLPAILSSPEDDLIPDQEDTNRAPDWMDQLQRLGALRARGILTDAEFNAEKSKLLPQQKDTE